MTGRLFISHASEDAAAASRIVAYLEARGAMCWVAPRDIPLKSVYAEEITRALQECKACAVIVSRAANSSEAVKRELELASHYRKPFIPIRIDATEPGPGLDYYLRNTQWLDLRTNQSAALDRLVAHVTDAAQAPAPQPADPEFPAKPPMKHAVAITLGVAALVAASMIAVLWPRPRSEEAAAVPASYYAQAHVVGDYNWDGVPCGQGPSATMEDGALVFRMEGVDPFVHQFLSATPDAANANPSFLTQLSAPEAHAGEMWELRVQDATVDTPATLTVSSPANPSGDTWTRCDATAPAEPIADETPAILDLRLQDLDNTNWRWVSGSDCLIRFYRFESHQDQGLVWLASNTGNDNDWSAQASGVAQLVNMDRIRIRSLDQGALDSTWQFERLAQYDDNGNPQNLLRVWDASGVSAQPICDYREVTVR